MGIVKSDTEEVMKERLLETLKWTERIYSIGFLLWFLYWFVRLWMFNDKMIYSINSWFLLASIGLPIFLVRWLITGDSIIIDIKNYLKAKF